MRELFLGLGLGLGAGVTPGALLSLVITASLRGGLRAGARLACVPLLSDLPVVLLSVTAAGALPGALVRGMSLAGGAYVIYLAVQSFREARTAALPRPGVGDPPGLVRKGVVVNLLNPHPWLFWLAVGGPLVVAAWRDTPWRALAFIAGFYLLLCGSKVILAGLIGAGRRRLGLRGFRVLLAGAAALMLGAGGALMWSGISP